MSSPFSATRIDLRGAHLGPLEPACCQKLAEAIAAIPPWSTMNYPADAMARFLVSSADGAYRYRIDAGGEPGRSGVDPAALAQGSLSRVAGDLAALPEPGNRRGDSGLVRAGGIASRSAQSLGLRLRLQRARLTLLSTARLQAGGGVAWSRRRRLYGDLAAEIPALKRPIARLPARHRQRERRFRSKFPRHPSSHRCRRSRA